MQRASVATSSGASDLRRNARRAGLVANFGLGKAAIYLAPLGIAAVASAPLYGAVEGAYAWGVLAATLLLTAPLHGISHAFLLRGADDYRDQVAALAAALCAASLLLTGALALAGAALSLILAAAILGPVSLQFASAFVLRMRARNLAIAWVEGWPLLFLLPILAAAAHFSPPSAVYLACAGLNVVSAAALLVAANRLRTQRGGRLGQRLAESFRIGASMAAYDMFNAWAAVSGRALVSILLPSQLAAYGVSFRIAALGLGVYRIATTLLWARLYRARTRAADRWLGRFLVGIAPVALGLQLFGPPIVVELRLDALPGPAARVAAEILPVVALQLFFAAGHALLQPRVNRSRAAGPSLRIMALVTLVSLAAAFAAVAGGAGLMGLSWIVAASSAAYFFAALHVLARRGLPHRRTATAGAAGGAVLAGAAVLTVLL